ncbi:MAG TPA: hypothetical protein VLY87_02500 [Flavobacterium sp.]|nr:hypothetical protein [Flavobacterium sp.]
MSVFVYLLEHVMLLTYKRNIENNININFQLTSEDITRIENMPQTGWSELNPDKMPF